MGVQHLLGAKIWPPKKLDLGGYDYTSTTPKLLDQGSPNFFHLTR